MNLFSLTNKIYVCVSNKLITDDTHMTFMKIVQFLGPPPPRPHTHTPLVQLCPKYFHSLDLGRPISNKPLLPLHMITNQLKEYIIQGWLLYVIRSFLQVGFRFQYQLINLLWIAVDFVSFSWSQPLFRLPLIVKRCAGVNVELKPHYLLFRG